MLSPFYPARVDWDPRFSFPPFRLQILRYVNVRTDKKMSKSATISIVWQKRGHFLLCRQTPIRGRGPLLPSLSPPPVAGSHTKRTETDPPPLPSRPTNLSVRPTSPSSLYHFAMEPYTQNRTPPSLLFFSEGRREIDNKGASPPPPGGRGPQRGGGGGGAGGGARPGGGFFFFFLGSFAKC